MVLFFSGLVVSLLISVVAEKRNNVFLFILSTLLVGFLAALRGVNVGIDTPGYYDIFSNLSIPWKISNMEPGFVFVAKQLMSFTFDPRVVVAFYSFFTVLFVLVRLWLFRKNGSYSFMLFVYVCLYFPLSLNIMRQFFALSIVFLATVFFDKRRYLPYLLFVALASLFHLSALFGVVIFAIHFIISQKSVKTKHTLIAASMLAIPLLFVAVVLVFGKYIDKYLQTATVEFGLMNFVKLGLVALFVAMNYRLIKKSNASAEVKYLMIIYTLGVVITSFGYLFSVGARIGLYCMMFEMPFIAFVTSKKNAIASSSFFKVAYLLICVYSFSTELLNNGNGIFPYYLNF